MKSLFGGWAREPEKEQKIIHALESIIDCLKKDDVQEQCRENIQRKNAITEDDLTFMSNILKLPPIGYRIVKTNEMRDYYKPQNGYEDWCMKIKPDVLCFNETTMEWCASICDEWAKGLTY